MRIVLLIFAFIGLAALALVIFIGSGLLRLSSLDRLAAGPMVGAPTSQPTTDPDDPDDAATTDPAPEDTTEPTVVDRSVFLSATDGVLTGPKIALMARDNIILKTGDGQPPPVQPELPQYGRGFRDGRHHRPPPTPYLSRWATPADCAQWVFESPAEGNYTVSLVYSGPPNHAGKLGGPFIVSIGSEEIVVSPKPTATATSFELADVGQLHLPKGQVHLTLRPQEKVTYDTSIRLRSVRLFPVEQE